MKFGSFSKIYVGMSAARDRYGRVRAIAGHAQRENRGRNPKRRINDPSDRGSNRGIEQRSERHERDPARYVLKAARKSPTKQS